MPRVKVIQKSALKTFCAGPARTACTDTAGLWAFQEIGGKDHFSNSPWPEQVNTVMFCSHTGRQTCKQINFQCRCGKASYGDPRIEIRKFCNTKLYCLFNRTMPAHKAELVFTNIKNNLKNKSSQTCFPKQGFASLQQCCDEWRTL